LRNQPHPLFAPADALAERAAALIGTMQDETLDITRKQHLDVVTTADLASERLILEGLRALTPDASILSEEAGGSIGECGWIVDPLDGTVNYASGLPWFSVTLAYLEGGMTVFGVAHAPKAGLIARYGDHGLATLNDRPVAVSRTENLSDAVISVALTSHFSPGEIERTISIIRRLAECTRGVRIVVSGGLEVALVAAGQLDGFVSLKADAVSHAGTMPLARAAGALVTNVAGEPSANEDLEKIAANPALHAKLLDVIRRG
jgi:myo-inositol-1(or 4)-monophosphatase